MTKSQLSPRTCGLTVNLRASSRGPITLTMLEFDHASVRTRLRFRRLNVVHEVARPSFARTLNAVWRLVMASSEPVVDERFRAAAGTMILTGLRAHGQVLPTGTRAAHIHFGTFEGEPEDLLNRGLPFGNTFQQQRERIAVDALEDILAPMIQLATLPRDDPRLTARQAAAVQARLIEMQEHADELQFRMALLTRYVRDCEAIAGGVGQATQDQLFA